jgi:PIN domain nuclease of toxin-antitoxin system
MPNPEKVLLLDTHVWLWLVSGAEPLRRSVLSAVEGAARRGRIRVSAISVWEVAMLEAKGRIRLAKDCLAWVQEALSAPGTSLVPLMPEIAVESSRLPGEFHGTRPTGSLSPRHVFWAPPSSPGTKESLPMERESSFP